MLSPTCTTFIMRGHIHIETTTWTLGLISESKKSEILKMNGNKANEATTVNFISVNVNR